MLNAKRLLALALVALATTAAACGDPSSTWSDEEVADALKGEITTAIAGDPAYDGVDVDTVGCAIGDGSTAACYVEYTDGDSASVDVTFDKSGDSFVWETR